MDEAIPGSAGAQSRICPMCGCAIVDKVDSWARDAQKRVVHLRCLFPQTAAPPATVIDERKTECVSDENRPAAAELVHSEPADSERKSPTDHKKVPVDLPRIFRAEFEGRTTALALTAFATMVMLAATALFISLPSASEVKVFVPAQRMFSSSERAAFNELDDPHMQLALAIADDESYRPARYETRTVHTNWAPARFLSTMITVCLLILVFKLFTARQQRCLEALRFATSDDSILKFSIGSPGRVRRRFEIFSVLPATREPAVVLVNAATVHGACRLVRERGLTPQLVATSTTISKAPKAADVPTWTLIPISAGILMTAWLVFWMLFI